MERLAISPVGVELLDDPAADPVAVTETLRNIARSNRWFGGTAAVLHGCRRLLADVPPGTTLSLLDLGTGAGDLPKAAAAWAARRGIRLTPVGLERSRVAAGVASAAGIPCAVGCGGAPPVREKGVDLVLLSQVLHHLAPSSVVRLLATCDRLARRGVVVADLRRSRFGSLAFWFGARALRFDRMTLADGITSIRRGYTLAELHEFLAAAGVTATIERRPGYRLVASWRTRPA